MAFDSDNLVLNNTASVLADVVGSPYAMKYWGASNYGMDYSYFYVNVYCPLTAGLEL